MSSPEGPPPPGGNIDRGPDFMALVWTETAVSIVVVALRFWARRLIKKTGFDDWAMLFTLLIFILWVSFATYYAQLGGFRHLYYLQGEQISHVTYYSYILQFIGTFIYAPAKTSVAALVLRIGGSATTTHGSWRKWLIYGSITVVWIATIINCIMTYAQCSPAAALWDPTIPHTCWNPTVEPNFAIFTGSVNVFTDGVLAFVPASLIWNLKIDMRKRINLTILLGLGVLAAVCGIVKATYLSTLSAHSDITWETYNLLAWGASELFVILFCGSVPTIKPLWDRYVSKKSYLTDASGYPARGTAGSDWHASRNGKPTAATNPVLSESREEVLDDTRPYSQNAWDGVHAKTDIEITSSDQWRYR